MNWNGTNRRKFVRVDFPYTLHVYTSEESAFSAYTENVSESGIMITVTQKLEISSAVGLEIYTKEKTIVCKGKVAWVKKRKSKYLKDTVFFDIGIEFVEIEEEDRDIIRNQIDN